MKNLYPPLLLLLLLLGSCDTSKEKGKTKQKSNRQKTSPSVDYSIPECTKISLEGFEADSSYINYINYLNGLDCHDAKSVGLAKKTLLPIIQKTDTSKADSLVYIFNNYYELVLNSLNSILEYDTSLYYTEYSKGYPDSKSSKKYKQFYQNLTRNGFIFIYPEGMVEVDQDRDILKDFYPYLTDRMKSYLKQVNHENAEWFQDDAAISITEKEFLNRVLWWEKFANENPDFIYSKESVYNKKYYLYYLLYGMDNTNPLDGHHGELNPYFKTLYELSYQSNKESEAILIIKKQYELIKANGMKGSDERDNYLKELENEDKILKINYE